MDSTDVNDLVEAVNTRLVAEVEAAGALGPGPHPGTDTGPEACSVAMETNGLAVNPSAEGHSMFAYICLFFIEHRFSVLTQRIK